MTGRLSCFVIVLSLSILPSLHGTEPILKGAKTVLFLGDSITYSGQYVDDIAAFLVTRFPERPIAILNLGLPSETVSGLSEEGHADGKFPRPNLHERLDRVIKAVQPDLVIACYGMNDGIYLPYSNERFAAFTNGLIRLREKVLPSARIIHVTPPVFDEDRGRATGYANTLDQYSNWMLAQLPAGWEVADVHGPMKRYLNERKTKQPEFYLAGDGVHPGDAGHWIMARSILENLGVKDLGNVDGVTGMLAGYANGSEILKLIQQKQRILKDAWLSSTGHKRPGMTKGVPLSEAFAKAAELDKKIHALNQR